MADSFTSIDDLLAILKIDYLEAENPARIFSAMSNLIEAFTALDVLLLESIDPNISNKIVLKGLETGSIVSLLANILEHTDEEGIKNLDWKRIVGGYVNQARLVFLQYMQDNKGLSDKEHLEKLINKLFSLAKKTDIKVVPNYRAIPPSKLLGSMLQVKTALEVLNPNDTVTYSTNQMTVRFNPGFEITPESISALIIKETHESEQTMILKIKKPDYLGDSQWELKHDKNTIKAKMLDLVWVAKFHRREFDLGPGDALKVKVKVKVNYGFSGEVISSNYDIEKVLQIIRADGYSQQNLFNKSHINQIC